MSIKNPYNISTQENQFNAWSLGYECSGSIESNPFGEDLEPELFRIFEQGHKAKNRSPKAPNLNAAASSTVINTSVTPQEFKQATNEPAGPVNLTLISLDKLCAEIVKRFKEYEEFKTKYNQVFK